MRTFPALIVAATLFIAPHAGAEETQVAVIDTALAGFSSMIERSKQDMRSLSASLCPTLENPIDCQLDMVNAEGALIMAEAAMLEARFYLATGEADQIRASLGKMEREMTDFREIVAPYFDDTE